MMLSKISRRYFASETNGAKNLKGLVLGAYKNGKLTKAASEFDQSTKGELARQLSMDFTGDLHETRVLYGIGNYDRVVVVGLGEEIADPTKQSEVKKNARSAAGAGTKFLRSKKFTSIEVECFGQPRHAGEGATLGTYRFEDCKTRDLLPSCEVKLLQSISEKSVVDAWNQGTIVAQSQNFARRLAELPANHITPTTFCERAQEALKGVRGVTVQMYDQKWAESKGMGAFIGVAKGSNEPLAFLEICYRGRPSAPGFDLGYVGKGVTFDAGGISIKPSADMGWMRGDMGGAAAVVSSIKAISELALPINIAVVTPLCENMPSGHATRPADVLKTMSGLTVEVDNTDAEGRLILADALTYIQKQFDPKAVLDVATLTGAIDVALGSAATGVFSNDDAMWKLLSDAGDVAHDPLWRMPLFPEYKKQLKSSIADLKNCGNRSGGACTAAAFLQEFVLPNKKWAHLDIAGVAWVKEEPVSETSGMTGRPVRALVEYANIVSQALGK